MKTATIAVATMTSVQALVTMASLTVSVYAPEAARDLGLAPESIGLYASLTYIGAMFGSLMAGGFVLRFGAIRFSQWAMLGCAFGLVLCIGASWWWFALSALILGLGYGPATPASSYLLSRHVPSRIWSLVFSIKQTGVPLGGVLAGLLVPLLLLYFSWQQVTLIVFAIVAVAALCLQIWRSRFDIDLQPQQSLLRGNFIQPLRLIFSRADLRLLALASFFFSAIQQSYIYFLVTYLVVSVSWSLTAAGAALSVVGLSAVFGRMVWGALADVSGHSRLILGLIALSMSVVVALTTTFDSTWSSWQIYCVCAAFGATGAAWNGVYLAEITRCVKPEEVGHATGGGLFVTFFGVVVTPPLFGLTVKLSGGFTFAYASLACAAFLIACLLLARRRSREVF